MIRILIADADAAARKALARYFGANWARTPAREAGAHFVHKGTPPAELFATLMPVLRKDT